MTIRRFASRKALSIVCALILLATGMPMFAQDAAPPPEQPPAPLLSPQQLDNLVAPVALYPDSLLSQVLVAATYPLEIAEAAQWLQQSRNLQGPQLVDAARQQNWDASIQALVVFPDVLNRMNSDIRWTTDLGNAFLAQQADVMNAVQRMRARARAAGRLNSNSQQTVTTETQGDNSAIEIQPANPQVVYVPVYSPEYIWGPPVWGYYPPLYYPAFGFGFGFGPGIYISGFFGGLGWGGWGWGPNWFGCSVFERGYFFGHYGYHGFHGDGRFDGVGVWGHNPEHRLGVAYPNHAVASRFGGFSGRGSAVASGRFGGQRAVAPGNGFGSRATTGANSHVAGPTSRGAQNGGWSHFSQTRPNTSARPNTSQGFQHSAPTYQRATPSNGGNHGFSGTTPGYRSSPSYQRTTPSNGGNHSFSGTTPSYRPSPSYQRPTPSYGGNRSFSGAAPSYQTRPSYGGNSARSMPSYHSTPSYGGGGPRVTRSYSGGSSGGNHSANNAFHGGGSSSGSFHGGGGGGASHVSGGGGHR